MVARLSKTSTIREALSCGRPGCACLRDSGPTHCPAHDDTNPSLSVRDDNRRNLVYCHAGCSQQAVIAALRERNLWPTETRWSVGNAEHVRRDTPTGKKVHWESNGSAGLDSLPVKNLPLYAIEDTAQLADGAIVVVCEGEPAADALRARGQAAVGTVCGAAVTPCDDSLRPLTRFRVRLWPDNDDVGRAHMQAIAGRLLVLGCHDIRVISWPDAPPKGDAADWGGTNAELAALVESAEPLAAPAALGPVVVTVANVEREEVRWLWDQRIAKGRLSALMGDPGAGKSFLTVAIATAISRGSPLPGETEASEPADVLFLCGEDGLADTVRPRLEDMGADLTRIHVLTAVRGLDGKDQHPSLIDHLGDIERALVERNCKLMFVDPINAYLGGSLDTHRDAALRSVLAPLAALCERLGVACVFVLHLTKSSRDRAMYRGQGSIGYTAAARVVLLAGANPENPDERALVWLKGNLTAPAPAIGYEISEGVFYWRGESNLTAGEILAPDADAGKQSALAEAKTFLLEALGDGPRPSIEVKKDARAAGIATRTLDRARREVGVRAIPLRLVGKAGVQSWTWALPEESEGLDCQECQVENLASLTPFVSESGGSTEDVGILNPAPCSICGSAEISGYTPEGEPRCFGHYAPESERLVNIAVALGATVRDRLPAFNLCCDDEVRRRF